MVLCYNWQREFSYLLQVFGVFHSYKFGCFQGKVKQIVGSTLCDSKEDGSSLVTNFESDKSAGEYANMYKEDGLTGGHVIMLGADPLSKAAAIEALHAYPGTFIAAFFFFLWYQVISFEFILLCLLSVMIRNHNFGISPVVFYVA